MHSPFAVSSTKHNLRRPHSSHSVPPTTIAIRIICEQTLLRQVFVLFGALCVHFLGVWRFISLPTDFCYVRCGWRLVRLGQIELTNGPLFFDPDDVLFSVVSTVVVVVVQCPTRIVYYGASNLRVVDMVTKIGAENTRKSSGLWILQSSVKGFGKKMENFCGLLVYIYYVSQLFLCGSSGLIRYIFLLFVGKGLKNKIGLAYEFTASRIKCMWV